MTSSLPPPWQDVIKDIPRENQAKFLMAVKRALKEYAVHEKQGRAEGELRQAAQNAAKQMLAGNKPKPLSTLSPTAMKIAREAAPSTARAKRQLGTAILISGAKIVIEKQGAESARHRVKVNSVADRRHGRPANLALDVLLSRLGIAWARATGAPSTSRHDGSYFARLSPFANMLEALQKAANVRFPVSADMAAKRWGELREKTAKQKD